MFYKSSGFLGALGVFWVQVVVLAPDFTHDKTKDGWRLLENVAEPTELKRNDLELVPFLRGDESYIRGRELRRRAKNMKCNFGQATAEYLLAHQSDLPEKFRDYDIVFPGTAWHVRDGYSRVPYLYWYHGQWRLGFAWLDNDWGGADRFLRLKQLAAP